MRDQRTTTNGQNILTWKPLEPPLANMKAAVLVMEEFEWTDLSLAISRALLTRFKTCIHHLASKWVKNHEILRRENAEPVRDNDHQDYVKNENNEYFDQSK